jgi:hypothetical protein
MRADGPLYVTLYVTPVRRAETLIATRHLSTANHPMEPLIPDPAPAPRNREIVLMMLTSAGDEYDLRDGKELRRLALSLGIPTVTTVAGCKATAMALQAMRRGPLVQVSKPKRMCGEGVDARKAKLSCC